MLHIVTRANQHSYQTILNQAFQKREFEIPFLREEIIPFAHTPKAVYFVDVDKLMGICGLARLLPRTGAPVYRHSSAQETRQSLHLWELNAIHFFLPDNLDFLRCELILETTANRFYQDLFQSLYTFSRQENIQQILIIEHYLILQDLQYVGWPLIKISEKPYDIPPPLAFNLMDFCMNAF